MITERLSNRMLKVIEYIDKGSRVADIGCDHAFVSIYLVKNKISPKVIAMDVKNGPLDIAKKNIKLSSLDNLIDVRLSDGLDKLELNEVDTAIIAGMGGPLIISILQDATLHINTGINLVLQPQSEIPKVREYLYDIGYEIIDEDMIFEEGKFYNIIKTSKSIYDNLKVPTILDLMFGEKLINKKSEVLTSFLKSEISKNEHLIQKLNLDNTDGSIKRAKELSDYLNKVEECYNLIK